MKKLTFYVFVICSLITISCLSQGKNYLTLTEYNNILVDGVKWGDIENTRGDISKMQALFGNTLSIETANEPSPSIGFGDKGFYLSFEDRSGRGNYYLVDFWINNNSSHITIKGRSFTLGDDISKLGNIKINTFNDGSKDVFFELKGNDSNWFSISINPQTNKITEIKYIDFD